jgi:hypothetical protein
LCCEIVFAFLIFFFNIQAPNAQNAKAKTKSQTRQKHRLGPTSVRCTVDRAARWPVPRNATMVDGSYRIGL